jgi:hypothetical protein
MSKKSNKNLDDLNDLIDVVKDVKVTRSGSEAPKSIFSTLEDFEEKTDNVSIQAYKQYVISSYPNLFNIKCDNDKESETPAVHMTHAAKLLSSLVEAKISEEEKMIIKQSKEKSN